MREDGREGKGIKRRKKDFMGVGVGVGVVRSGQVRIID